MLISMTFSAALCLAFLPALLWAVSGTVSALVPLKSLAALLAAGLLSGLGAVVCAVVLQIGFGSVLGGYGILSPLIIAVTEEGSRTAATGAALAVLAAAAGFPASAAFRSGADSADRSADASGLRRRLLWFGLLAGLFFFALESLWFILRSPDTLLLRLFWTLPLHGAAGVMTARVFVPVVPTNDGKRRRSWSGMVLAVAFHAAWDFCRDPERAASPAFLFLSLLTLLGAVFTAFLYWNAAPEPAE